MEMQPVQFFPWPVPGRGRWRVGFDVDEAGRRVGIHLASMGDPKREVTGALLRDLGTRFGQLREADAEFRRAFFREVARDRREDARQRAKARRLASRRSNTRKGRPRHHDLAKVAEVYAVQVGRGNQAPVKAVAEALGTTRSYASKLVARAKRDGYLPSNEKED